MFKNLFGGAGSGKASKGIKTRDRVCPAGHPMGRDWTECPYCEAAKHELQHPAGYTGQAFDAPSAPASAADATRINMPSADLGATRLSMPSADLDATRISMPAADLAATKISMPAADPAATRLSMPIADDQATRVSPPPAARSAPTPSADLEQTVIVVKPAARTPGAPVSRGTPVAPTLAGAAAVAAAGSPPAAIATATATATAAATAEAAAAAGAVGTSTGPTRRITAVIHSFSRHSAGRLFVLREGRSYAGSGAVASAGNRPADILIGDDPHFGSPHFVLDCLGGRHRIQNCDHSGGTRVDGVLIDHGGVELRDGAVIRAGDTTFRFQMIQPADA